MAKYSTINKDLVFAIERKALENAQEEFVLDRFTDKKSMPQKSGNALKFHRWEHIDEADVHTLTEGVTPDSTDMVRVSVEGTLARRGAWVPFTDELMEQHENAGEFHKETGKELGYVVGRVLEKDMFTVALAGAGTTVAFSSIDADLKSVRTALRTANAPKFTTIKTGSTKIGTKPVAGGWYGFFSLADSDLARAAADFLPVEDYGYTDGIAPNEIGVIKSLGLRIVETAYVADGNALFIGDGGLASLGLGGKNRLEYIVRELGDAVGVNSTGDAVTDALKQNGTSGIKTRVGSVVLNPAYVVKMATA